jgi:hypothetical protein
MVVRQVICDNEFKTLISASDDLTLKKWDSLTGAELGIFRGKFLCNQSNLKCADLVPIKLYFQQQDIRRVSHASHFHVI